METAQTPAQGAAGVAGTGSGKAAQTITGMVSGAITVASSASVAALVFAGPLEPFLGAGIGLVLLAAIVAGSVIAMAGSFAGTVANPPDRMGPLLAILVGGVQASLPPDATPELRFHSAVAAIVLASLLTGASLALLGWLRLGSLTRFVPYPVIGGFLAGTGLLLVQGAFGVLTGGAPVDEWLSGEQLLRWLPGLAVAVSAIALLRRWRHFLILPAVIFGGALVFHLGVAAAGFSTQDAFARGWLVGPFAERLGSFPPSRLILDADWSAVFGQPGAYAAIILVSTVSVLLNYTALEVEAESDIDLDRELRVTGAANLATGVLGGAIGFIAVSLSTLSVRMGTAGRLVGIMAAATCLAVWLGGMGLVALLPRAVVGGLLLFLGFSFLIDWLVDGWRRLSRGDYLILWLILVTIATAGYLEGVVVGLVAAAILFVVNYSRVDVVRHELSGSNQRSNVDRPLDQQRALRESGGGIHILKLQGYIFFGTANRLLIQLRERAARSSPSALKFAILDFRRVPGLDSSAAFSFTRMLQLAEREGFLLAFSGANDTVAGALRDAGIVGREGMVRWFEDLDHAMEWCENLLLEHDSPTASAEAGLAGLIEDPLLAARLAGRLAQKDIAAGELLVRQGAAADELYYIRSGEVTVQLEVGEGRMLRLRKMGPGTIIGETGLYLAGDRSASVLADSATRVQVLSREDIATIEREDPPLAAAFHRAIAKLLAERLANSNRTLREMLD